MPVIIGQTGRKSTLTRRME